MKKILIIDDHGCRYCPCAVGYAGCAAAEKEFNDGLKRQIENRKTADGMRAIWCPLKDIPKPKNEWNGDNSYEAGWNDVLDLIGGLDG